jgi:hypothetical protein
MDSSRLGWQSTMPSSGCLREQLQPNQLLVLPLQEQALLGLRLALLQELPQLVLRLALLLGLRRHHMQRPRRPLRAVKPGL